MIVCVCVLATVYTTWINFFLKKNKKQDSTLCHLPLTSMDSELGLKQFDLLKVTT